MITVVPFPDAPFQPAHRRYSFNFDRLSALIDSGRSWAKEVYGWGTASTDLAGLFSNVADALQSFGWVAGINNLARSDEELILGRSVPEADTSPMPRAGVAVFEAIPPDTAKAGVAVFGLRASSPGATDAGLGLMPFLSKTSPGPLLT